VQSILSMALESEISSNPVSDGIFQKILSFFLVCESRCIVLYFTLIGFVLVRSPFAGNLKRSPFPRLISCLPMPLSAIFVWAIWFIFNFQPGFVSQTIFNVTWNNSSGRRTSPSLFMDFRCLTDNDQLIYWKGVPVRYLIATAPFMNNYLTLSKELIFYIRREKCAVL